MDDEPAVEREWTDYASLQEQIRRRAVVNHKSWALEDKAEAFLVAVGKRSVPTEVERRDKWLNNLETNRQKKYRNRSEILERHAPELSVSVAVRTELDRLIQVERLIQIRNSTTAQEFRILCRRAADDAYDAIALDEKLSVAAIKTKVYRCRQRLQTHLEA